MADGHNFSETKKETTVSQKVIDFDVNQDTGASLEDLL